MVENPYNPPHEPTQSTESESKTGVSSGRAAYNVVTDTVTGVNVRWSDNRFQAIFILVSTLVMTVIGAALAFLGVLDQATPWFFYAILFGFLGLLLGLFTSGTALMFYRSGRHLTGKHD